MITRGNRLFSGRLDASKFLGNGSNGYIYACLPQNLFDGEGHPRIRNIPMERHFSRIFIRDINDSWLEISQENCQCDCNGDKTNICQ